MTNRFSQPVSELPRKLYRGFLMLTSSWLGSRAGDGSLLIKVHEVSNSNKLPLIWVGGPLELDTVVAICGQDRTIYGLRGTFDYVDSTEENIRTLSKHYTNEILHLMPSEAYVIAGYCDASRIAIEVASDLLSRGQKVAFLGLVDCDVSESNTELKVVRFVYAKLDRLGAIAAEFSEIMDKYSFGLGLLNCAKHFVSQVSSVFKRPKADPRTLIKYESDEHTALHYIRPYQGKVNLFFIGGRSALGFYEFKHFQKYWQKVALGGMAVDLIAGVTHKYPPWVKIITKMQQRIAEAGY